MKSNFALERTAGSRALAAAAQLGLPFGINANAIRKLRLTKVAAVEGLR